MNLRRVLAQGEFTAVETCPCGTVYLVVGPVTLRLDNRALDELRGTVDQAARTLAAERAIVLPSVTDTH